MKRKRIGALFLVLAILVSSIGTESGLRSQAASTQTFHLYMARKTISYANDGEYVFTEIEKGMYITDFISGPSSNALVTEQQESFNPGVFNYVKLTRDVETNENIPCKIDENGDLQISNCCFPRPKFCGGKQIMPIGYKISLIQGIYIVKTLGILTEENTAITIPLEP